jgi:redox-sensitive bicupin YhaK (pirin superfamily)
VILAASCRSRDQRSRLYLFSYRGDTAATDPFLLLDYAPPYEFRPGTAPRGVGEHPHRGFETVTIVYQGELEHVTRPGITGRSGPAMCSG